mmetsp:Transcript_102631/g.299402  ORF Transcript_102631/g.299402 Transcript_102631/m.299402 type:complete len:306 (+) Transcript_102631:60-977(+)
MSQLLVYAVSSAITLAIQLGGFAVAFALQTEKFYDILGGVNYMALAAYSAASANQSQHPWSSEPRKILATLLLVCSRGWLLSFLAWRAHERQGDARFDGVKDKFGKFLVFWVVQGMWVMLISMPVLFINSSSVNKPLSKFDWLMIAGFTAGVVIEVVADVQKAAWVKPGRVGGFCQAGVWAFSRHPNYFGEMSQWWFAWALAYSSSQGLTDWLWWACIVSPLFTMHILLNVPATGVAQANGKNLKRYYEKHAESYARYRRSTSILVPMVGYEYVPMFLKRTVFLDLARYEYRVKSKSEPDTDKAK